MIHVCNLRKEDTYAYGAKAANLGELSQLAGDLGFMVPLGIVYSETQYLHFGKSIDLSSYKKFIVRSSFVGEDSISESMAGCFKSIVTDSDGIAEAVEEVFASGPKTMVKNVLIQPYIEAKSSGEYFTCNPDDSTKPGLWTKRNGNGGTVDGTINVADMAVPLRFSDIGSQLVIYFGRHLDIEWVIDEDDNLWIVQLRPITGKATETEKILVGLGLGNDYEKGIAVVVNDPDDFDSTYDLSDCILVAPHTNRKWESIMRGVNGMITDHGTNTCHASIFSREIGLTAVIGTMDATKKIKTGDFLFINTLDKPGFGVVHREV